MSRDQQEMLHRQKPGEGGSGGAMETVPQQEREFNRGGGGGGPPFVAFSVGSMSTSTRTVCEPDPNDPNHQICKTITQRRQLNPSTGKYDTFREQKQITPPSRRSYSQTANHSRNQLPPPQQPSLTGFFSNIKNNFSKWWNRNEGHSGFIGTQNSGRHQITHSQNSVTQRDMNDYYQAPGQEFDPFREIEAEFFGPLRRMGHPFFQDDPFDRMHRSFFDNHDPMASFFANDPIFGRLHGRPTRPEGGSGGFQAGSPFARSSFFEEDFPVATFFQTPDGHVAHITPEAIRELKNEIESQEREENARFDRKYDVAQEKKQKVAAIPDTKHRSSMSDKIYDV